MNYWHLFSKTQTVSVASVEGDQARVRPMTLICMHQKLFLATGSNDAKVQQWLINPHLEVMFPQKNETNSGYLRIAGTVATVKDIALKKAVADHAGFIYNYWLDAANPDFILYEICPVQWRYLKPGEELEEISSAEN